MEWLANAFWARIGWMMAEVAMWAAVAAVVLLLVILVALPGIVRQARCKHASVRETSACDAICRDCGKNLGFIGSWRDRAARIEHS